MLVHQHLFPTNTYTSLYYFQMASSAIENKEYTSISELQVGLVLVLYLINTSKFDLARRSLQLVISSPIFRTLFQASTAQGSEIQQVLFWVIHYLDMHISCLLGVNAQLDCPDATIYAINTAVRNVTLYKRSDSTFLLSVSLAIAIESLKLIKCIVSDTLPETSPQKWTDLEAELGTLESAFRRIFPDDDSNLQISL
jgi:hypothetical protein